MRRFVIAAGAALLAGCGQEQAANTGNEPVPAALNPGEYEVATVVESVRSTDRTEPATKVKAQDKVVAHRACIAGDGTVEPAMFSEIGDECRIDNLYARNGRMQMTLSCSRPDTPGVVAQQVSGTFSAEGFDTVVETATYFTGAGDYSMRRKMTGKRVGECAAKPD